MTLRVRAGGATDVGRVRQVNQDSFVILDDRGLYAVADGMGGHQGGEVASRLAVEALQASYAGADPDALVDAIEEANLRIHEQGESDPALQGMGTTVVAVAVQADHPGDGSSLLVANVGDSRAYLFRDGDLTQLTEDHSMVADLVREGRITAEEAEVHPQRNIVTRVLGVYDEVDVDLWPVDAVRGDRLLLCSDGLFNEVPATQLASVLRRLSDPQEAADELVRLANQGGGRDNVTVLIVDVIDDGGVAESASAGLDHAASGVRSGGHDPAGFGSAKDDPDEPVAAPVATAAAEAKPPRVPLLRRVTWRVAGFAVLLLAVIGGAFATIQWYGTHAYFVGFDKAGHVVVYQGRPGGVLWIDPKQVTYDTHLQRDDLVEASQDGVAARREQATLHEAKQFVKNLGTTTTTTTPTTTTLVDPNATTTTAAPPPTG